MRLALSGAFGAWRRWRRLRGWIARVRCGVNRVSLLICLTRSARVHVRETVECVPVEYVPPLAQASARIPNFYTGPRARAKDVQD